jgi:CO/xanthine dehydrogenase FAD-binding subunit
MRSRFEYLRPATVAEALGLLAEHGSRAAVLAGGTDIMVAARAGALKSDFLVDVSRIEQLRSVELDDGTLRIGAAATFSEIVSHVAVRRWAPVLARAAGCVGSLQIRNVATIGGNVANASPAADSLPALMVHDALVEIRSSSTLRLEALEDFVSAPYECSLKPGELIVGFRLTPLDASYRTGFQRIARRRAVSIARANAAAAARWDGSGVVSDIRLSVGSVAPRPVRMTGAENIIKGKTPNESMLTDAARSVVDEMVRRSGVRLSTEYKKPAVEGLVLKVLAEVIWGTDR